LQCTADPFKHVPSSLSDPRASLSRVQDACQCLHSTCRCTQIPEVHLVRRAGGAESFCSTFVKILETFKSTCMKTATCSPLDTVS
jgi:hypothetical protein